MHNLSEQAQELIANFEKRIESVPASERDEVLKRMTSHIAALDEEARGLLRLLRGTNGARHSGNPPAPENDVNRISDFL